MIKIYQGIREKINIYDLQKEMDRNVRGHRKF
jgi:hypothetical protein